MYRATDPRFRRRLNEIGQTLEHANESAQSNIYIFTQTYIKPCFESISSGVASCIDASCPTLNLASRDRLRRQRGRSRGHAELNFDFYDDWDEDENDALLGWGSSDDLDRLLTGGGSYGTTANTQPARQRGMSYPKGRRRSLIPPHDVEPDPTVIPGSGGFFGKLFGGKALRYKPSAAGLQEHPGTRRARRGPTEGEALLNEERGSGRRHGRQRSGTVGSGHTTDSLSSRGDIFPSDGEDDAVPLDDEFAMVLERRTTQSGGQEFDGDSGHRRSVDRKRGKRPSAGSRRSTGRSAPSTRSRRSNSSPPRSPVAEVPSDEETAATSPQNMTELKLEDRTSRDEEVDRDEQKLDNTDGLPSRRHLPSQKEDDLSSKEATPQALSPVIAPLREPGLDSD